MVKLFVIIWRTMQYIMQIFLYPPINGAARSAVLRGGEGSGKQKVWFFRELLMANWCPDVDDGPFTRPGLYRYFTLY